MSYVSATNSSFRRCRQIRPLPINRKNIYQQLHDGDILLTFICVIINVTFRRVYAKKKKKGGHVYVHA